jgi:hypothetical protein
MNKGQPPQASGAGSVVSAPRSGSLIWLVAGVAAVFLALIAALPVIAVPVTTVPDAATRLQLQNDVRTTLLQGIGGLVVLLGAYLTWRQLDISRRQLRHSLDASTAQLELSRQGQITEQFSRATDQLGHDRPGVRVAAIYTLEQIASMSPELRDSIHQLLSAYVRAESPWSHHDPVTLTAIEPDLESTPATLPMLKVRAPDVQAAMQVLTRGANITTEVIDLQGGVDLRAAHLNGANLRRANLGRGTFVGAELIKADLSDAWLRRVSFRGAWLIDANLRGAILQDADLRGTDLTGADLSSADVRRATFDESTKWPSGFDWQAAGAIRTPKGHQESTFIR